MITTSSLVKRYGTQNALDGVDLEVPEGSIYGLVGPNGAGKTTLLSLLAGLRRPTSGRVELGVDRRAVAVLPDTPQFDPWLTAAEVVDLARHLADPSLPEARVPEILAQAGLEEAADRRVGGFSRGMLQRLGLAATVVGRPALLLLDEPASALDPVGRREVLDLIVNLRNRATVVFSSHILNDVEEVCDRVGILVSGRLRVQGSLADLLAGAVAPLLIVKVRPPADRLVTALREVPWVTGVETYADVVRVRVTDRSSAEAGIAGLLAGAEAAVVSLRFEQPDLERAFLELAGGA